MNCKQCGKQINRSYTGMCQSCYNYFRKGGIEYNLPEPGRIEYDATGKVICHICGRSYARLGSHVKESHDMTIESYKEQFGLCKRTKTTEMNYSKMMHNYAKQNKMDNMLLDVGVSTRIKKGENDKRKGKQVCLQEILDKRARKFKTAK
jgi:NMD protein affecting ribosome stability and mRNA decay